MLSHIRYVHSDISFFSSLKVARLFLLQDKVIVYIGEYCENEEDEIYQKFLHKIMAGNPTLVVQ